VARSVSVTTSPPAGARPREMPIAVAIVEPVLGFCAGSPVPRAPANTT
jgi:hypothetical protein